MIERDLRIHRIPLEKDFESLIRNFKIIMCRIELETGITLDMDTISQIASKIPAEEMTSRTSASQRSSTFRKIYIILRDYYDMLNYSLELFKYLRLNNYLSKDLN